jgi:ketosteroid isomerase-like protein
MNRTSAAAAIVTITAAASVMLATSALAQHPSREPIDEIRAVEREWNEARAHADIATLDRILDDGWTVTHANGSTDTKARYLADLKSGVRRFSGEVSETDLSVRFYGDTAIASGSSESRVTLNGQPQGGSLHFTRVYVKRTGAWKMVVTQATTRQP